MVGEDADHPGAARVLPVHPNLTWLGLNSPRGPDSIVYYCGAVPSGNMTEAIAPWLLGVVLNHKHRTATSPPSITATKVRARPFARPRDMRHLPHPHARPTGRRALCGVV
jgi:hypothetical protein